jgi:formylglycine-generating enzyme required for sulfatase activity
MEKERILLRYQESEGLSVEELQTLKSDMISYMNSSEEIETRLEIGCLLSCLGDPRLAYPSDSRYWIKVETAYLDLLVGRFPVTTMEWRYFSESEHYLNDSYWSDDGLIWRNEERPPWSDLAQGEDMLPFVVENQPVVGVSWFEAEAYARYSGARLLFFDERIDIVRGEERRIYPWGSSFGQGNANTLEVGLKRPCPVGLFSKDSIPSGISDLVGNVGEWTEDRDKFGCRIHPGSWRGDMLSAWPKASMTLSPAARLDSLGFRLAREL